MKAEENDKNLPENPFEYFENIFKERQAEADEFYAGIQPASLLEDERMIQRQAFAGMLWSKQFYHYNIEEWLDGDPSQPAPPAERIKGRNRAWRHMHAADILSMPDKWEYPWFAAWDLAFHCIPLAILDSEFAKQQLICLGANGICIQTGRSPLMNGTSVMSIRRFLAWATWRVYKIDQRDHGKGDQLSLTRIPQVTAQLHLVGQSQGH